MSNVMAVHMRYNSWYISLPSSVKHRCEMKSAALPVGEHEPRRIIFQIYILNFTPRSIFSFEIKLNDKSQEFFNAFIVKSAIRCMQRFFFFMKR